MMPIQVMRLRGPVSAPPLGDFPEYLDITPTDASAGTTTPKVVNYPATVNAGDLLLLFATWSSAEAGAPAGWTLVKKEETPNISCAIYAMTASGSEGGGTFSYDVGARAQFQVLRVKAGTYSGFEAGSSSASIGDTIIPTPGLSPSWGAAKTLWICGMSCQNTRTVSSYPLPDNQVRTVSAGSASNTWRTLASCSKKDEASSLPSANFVISASSVWAAFTIAIKPV